MSCIIHLSHQIYVQTLKKNQNQKEFNKLVNKYKTNIQYNLKCKIIITYWNNKYTNHIGFLHIYHDSN